jgi:hypothetical protein
MLFTLSIREFPAKLVNFPVFVPAVVKVVVEVFEQSKAKYFVTAVFKDTAPTAGSAI